MKIGIITWFGGVNYGTNLQAIGLSNYLKKQGYTVELLNFNIYSNKHIKRSFLERIYSQPEKYISKYYFNKYKDEIEKKTRVIEKTLLDYCEITKRITNDEEYIIECNKFDLLIFGSDQIWNPNWYHRYYYADYPSIKTRRIAYAPSFGVDSIPNDSINDIKRSLSKFDSISVREESGAQLIDFLMKQKAQVVVDPTFLLEKEEWDKMASKQIKDEEYVLGLFLTDNVFHWHASKKFAKEKGLKLVVIPYLGYSYMQGDCVYKCVGIEELLSLIKNAEYVVTDSFHITVFSIIFNKQFVSFERFNSKNNKSQNTRLENMLKMFGLENQLLPYNSYSIPERIINDYSSTNHLVKQKIEESKEYLSNVIGEENNAV